MVDPALFDDRSYTWGVILAAVAVLAMIGVLFTLPQFFQGVLGVSAAESGLRLVPLIVGIALAPSPPTGSPLRSDASSSSPGASWCWRPASRSVLGPPFTPPSSSLPDGR